MWGFSTVGIRLALERIPLIIAILSVIAVFLAPSGFGPHSAVNGPTTVFKPIQHADALKAAVSPAVLKGIRPRVSMIQCLRITTSYAAGSEWIDTLEKYCVRLC
jgi:hypothetical protein